MLTETGVTTIVPWAGVALGRALVGRAGGAVPGQVAGHGPGGGQAVAAAAGSRRSPQPMTTAEVARRIAEADLALVLHEAATRPAGRPSACPTTAEVLVVVGPEGGIAAGGAGRLRRRRGAAGLDQRRRAPHLDRRRGRRRPAPRMTGFGFTVGTRLPGGLGRTGVITTPHGRDPDAGVHRGRHPGHGQGGAAREPRRARRPGRAGQRLPPVPAAGRRHRRGRRRPGRVHELAGSDLHRQRRLPGDVARASGSRRCWP